MPIPKFGEDIIISSSESSSFFMMICLFFWLRGNISYRACCYYFVSSDPLPPFFNYFTLSAYLRVFRVFSQDPDPGETFPIIRVRQKPVKESFSTMVNLLPRKGVWFFPWSRARMHYFKASRLLLISAPSILVCLFWSKVSAPLSQPAKSMKEIFPKSFFEFIKEICRMA